MEDAAAAGPDDTGPAEVRADESTRLVSWSITGDRARRGASKAATLLSGIAGAVWLSNVSVVVGVYHR
jgi:hypothetical protein